MSKALDIAAAMADRINSRPALAGLALVDRQKNLVADVARAVGKAKGCCVTLLYLGFSNSDPRRSGLASVTRRYAVRVWCRPVLTDPANLPADDVMEQVAVALHDWDPPEATSGGSVQILVGGGDLMPDLKYLIYNLDVEVTSRL